MTANVLQLLLDVFHDLPADIGVHDLPSPEHHGDFDLVLLLQKFSDMLDLDLQIMLLRLRAEPDLFDLNCGLALLGP